MNSLRRRFTFYLQSPIFYPPSSGRHHLRRAFLFHAGEESLGVLGNLVLGEVLFVRRNGPLMPERILYLAVAVAPELIAHRHLYFAAGLHRAVESGIGVLDVHVKRRAGPAAAFGRKTFGRMLTA